MTALYPVHLRHAEHYRTVLRTADWLYQKGGEDLKQGLLLLQLESPNIQSARSWTEMHAGSNDRAALLCSDYQMLGAYLFDLTEHPSRRKVWLKVALAAVRRLGDRSAEGRHLNNPGMAYDELGKPKEAITFYEQRLIIAREIGDLQGESQTLGNLGVSYKNSGDAVRAIECFEKQLSIS
jgi:tetratricopeptide (TPR) repeat protein